VFKETFNLKRFELISSRVKGNVILDFGSYQGELHKYLETKLNKNILGIDVIKNKFVDIVHDFNKFPYPIKSNYVDCIVASEVVEHLNKPFDFLLECKRVLKKGGKLILTTPNMTGLHYILNQWDNKNDEHLFAWNLPLLKSLIRKIGMKIEEVELMTAYWNRNIIYKTLCFLIPNIRTNIFVVCRK